MHDQEVREQAAEAFIFDGLTFDQVSEQTGVSVATLTRWASEDPESTWTSRRREYRKAGDSIRQNTLLLRKRLIAKALTSLHPQDVFAVSNLEALISRKSNAGAAADDAAPGIAELHSAGEAPEIRTAQDAVDALQQAISAKINGMSTRPDQINLAAVKDIKQTLELIDQLKTRYKPEEKVEKGKGLSDEAVQEIRKKILGIK